MAFRLNLTALAASAYGCASACTRSHPFEWENYHRRRPLYDRAGAAICMTIASWLSAQIRRWPGSRDRTPAESTCAVEPSFQGRSTTMHLLRAAATLVAGDPLRRSRGPETGNRYAARLTRRRLGRGNGSTTSAAGRTHQLRGRSPDRSRARNWTGSRRTIPWRYRYLTTSGAT